MVFQRMEQKKLDQCEKLVLGNVLSEKKYNKIYENCFVKYEKTQKIIAQVLNDLIKESE